MKSAKSNRDLFSPTSSKAFSKNKGLNDDLFEQSDTSSEITSFIFEDLLPVVCAKYMCEVDVVVTKEQIKDDSASRYKKSEAFMKSRKTSADVQPILKKVSSRDTCSTKADSLAGQSLETPGTVIIRAFYDHNDQLKEILMNNLGMIPSVLIRSITLVAPLYDQLTKFTIRNSRVEGLVLNELHKILSLTALSEICLDDSRLPHGQVSLLLEKETQLKYLSLARCRICDKVCIEIVSQLHFQKPAEKKLSVLNLSSNRLTNRSAIAIGEMLRTNRHLRYLNISGNFISDDGAENILEKLVEFPLRSEEILAKRFRVIDNLKRRKLMVAEFLASLEAGYSIEAGLGVEGKQFEMRHKKSGLMLFKNAKTKDKIDLDPASRMAKAYSLADQMMAQIFDPFSNNNIVSRNGWFYCIGNFSLCFINISYNDLSYFTLKLVSDVMNYQNNLRNSIYSKCDATATSKRTDLQGLIKIVLEGNNLPETAQEYTVIQMLSNKALMNINDAGGGGTRRRSRVKATGIGRP